MRVTYENEETGFRVVRVSADAPTAATPTLRLGKEPKATPTSVSLVGVFSAVGPGARVRATGRYEQDSRHGRQFRADSVVVIDPSTLESIERFLGSGIIAGLGPGFAKRIVGTFGKEALQVLDQQPERLREVPGLKGERLRRVRTGWAEQRRLSNVRLLLQSHGASLALASRIIDRYDDRAAMVVERHPYRLALEVRGVGFKTADRIASTLGVRADHPERVQAGVVHCLGKLAEAGHVCCPRAELGRASCELLGVELPHVEAGVDALWAAERVVVENEDVFLARYHKAESELCSGLLRVLRRPSRELAGLREAVGHFERETGHTLSAGQRACLQQAGAHKVLVITGGPGVGKTTVVRAVLRAFEAAKLEVNLAAPTGRAAKRLGQATGRRATTLHRLLEFEPRAGRFKRDEQCPLSAQAVIVDEASMVDVELARSLVAALGDDARLVLVGDADQLPSVGPGSVLQDLIQSGRVPTARLSTIFRQGEGSSIVHNAHSILSGEKPITDASGSRRQEFFVVERRDPERAAQLIGELVEQRIPSRFGFDPLDEVQVLSPMHRGGAGTQALNELLQRRLNPDGAQLEHGDSSFRVGDKVMQLKNDYEKEVYNGDVGRIAGVDTEAHRMRVVFEGRSVSYAGRELDALVLAYAVSVHKSQGSEYPAVVLPLLTSHFPMLSRNLLYTAVTRAKRLCVLVADSRALELALAELGREARQTRLVERLQHARNKA